MKYPLIILCFLVCLCTNAQKPNPQYNPLKHNIENAKGSKDTLKAKFTDTVFVGLFYCIACKTEKQIYAVNQVFNKAGKKWIFIKTFLTTNDIPLPYQVFYVVDNSNITDTALAIKQLIKIKP